jgi:hypothetical protein
MFCFQGEVSDRQRHVAQLEPVPPILGGRVLATVARQHHQPVIRCAVARCYIPDGNSESLLPPVRKKLKDRLDLLYAEAVFASAGKFGMLVDQI